LKEAEAALGQPVRAIFDAEAAKTVGLERRLLAEKAAPKADVFWNSEYLRTYRLAQQGVVQAPVGVDAKGVAPEFRAQASTGFGQRARVLAINTQQVTQADWPHKLEDLTNPRWKGRVAVAKPLFGTTATHFAALYSRWGAPRFTAFLQALKKNDVMVLPGNGDVRDAVVAGRAAMGLTDTDDAVGALRRQQPLAMVFPDQTDEGTFAVYMTVAQVQKAPNAKGAAQLAAYLASDKVEQRLVELGAVQIPVRESLPMAKELGQQRPKLWHVPAAQLEANLAPAIELIKQHLL
jgi:iron(III) transport system substrate-binding protein